MIFTTDLRTAASPLTAKEAAASVSPLLPLATMNSWLAGYRTPPAWTQTWILGQVQRAAKAKLEQQIEAHARLERQLAKPGKGGDRLDFNTS